MGKESARSSFPAKRNRGASSNDEDSENDGATTGKTADDEYARRVCGHVAEDPVPARQLYVRQAKLDRKPIILGESTDESDFDEDETETGDNEPLTPASSVQASASRKQEQSKMAEQQLICELGANEALDDEIAIGAVPVA